MTLEIPWTELRDDTDGVLRRVEAGEVIVITRHGKPVANLVPHADLGRSAGDTTDDLPIG